MTLDQQAFQAIEAYDWPGNVREMENVIERTVALTDGEIISCNDLPPDIGSASKEIPAAAPQVTEAGIDMNRVISDIEREMIGQALALGNGVKARAAGLLSINRTTLVEKIKRLKMSV